MTTKVIVSETFVCLGCDVLLFEADQFYQGEQGYMFRVAGNGRLPEQVVMGWRKTGECIVKCFECSGDLGVFLDKKRTIYRLDFAKVTTKLSSNSVEACLVKRLKLLQQMQALVDEHSETVHFFSTKTQNTIGELGQISEQIRELKEGLTEATDRLENLWQKAKNTS
jgi:hypothetical protein